MKKRVFYQVMAGIVIASLVYCPYVQAMGEGPIPQEVPGISKELLEIVTEIKKQNNPSAEMTPEHVKKLMNTPEAKKMMHDPEVQKKVFMEVQSLAKDPEKRRKIVKDNLTPEVLAEIHKNQPALEKKIKEDLSTSLQKIDCKALKASGASSEYVAFVQALQDNITTHQGVLVPTKELHDLAKKVPEQGKVSREFKDLVAEIEKNKDNPDTTAKLMARLVATPEFGMMMGDITTQKLNKHVAHPGWTRVTVPKGYEDADWEKRITVTILGAIVILLIIIAAVFLWPISIVIAALSDVVLVAWFWFVLLYIRDTFLANIPDMSAAWRAYIDALSETNLALTRRTTEALAATYGHKGNWRLPGEIKKSTLGNLFDNHDGTKKNFFYGGVGMSLDSLHDHQYTAYAGYGRNIGSSSNIGFFVGHTVRRANEDLMEVRGDTTTIGGTYGIRGNTWYITNILSASYTRHYASIEIPVNPSTGERATSEKRLSSTYFGSANQPDRNIDIRQGYLPLADTVRFESYNVRNQVDGAYTFQHEGGWATSPHGSVVIDVVYRAPYQSTRIGFEYESFNRIFIRPTIGINESFPMISLCNTPMKPFMDISYSTMIGNRTFTTERKGRMFKALEYGKSSEMFSRFIPPNLVTVPLEDSITASGGLQAFATKNLDITGTARCTYSATGTAVGGSLSALWKPWKTELSVGYGRDHTGEGVWNMGLATHF